MSEESEPATESRATGKAKAVTKKAVEKVEEAAGHVADAVRDGFDKVIESIDDLQKPDK